MDDDPVLRALGEDLARDDPDLAARLTAGPAALPGRRAGAGGPPPGRGLLLLVVLGAVAITAAPFLFGPAVFGVLALLVLFGCPFVIGRWCLPDPGDDVPPRPVP